MKSKKRRKKSLIVSEEALEDFLILSTTERLRGLDEMRTFLSKTLSRRAKQALERFRRR